MWPPQCKYIILIIDSYKEFQCIGRPKAWGRDYEFRAVPWSSVQYVRLDVRLFVLSVPLFHLLPVDFSFKPYEDHYCRDFF